MKQKRSKDKASCRPAKNTGLKKNEARVHSAKAMRKAAKRKRGEEEQDPLATVRRGPPCAPTSGRLSGSVVNDEWQTVRRSWQQVAHLFDAYRAKRIWSDALPRQTSFCAHTAARAAVAMAGAARETAPGASICRHSPAQALAVPFYYDGACAQHLQPTNLDRLAG